MPPAVSTVTASLNAIVMSMFVWGAWLPSLVVEETDWPVGAPLSITSALFAPSEREAPGRASVRSRSFMPLSLMVPVSALVAV